MELESKLRPKEERSLHRVVRVLEERWEYRLEELYFERSDDPVTYDKLILEVKQCLDDLRVENGKHSNDADQQQAGGRTP